MDVRVTAVGEDTQALARFVFGLTLGVGTMAAVIAALSGQPMVVIAVPTMLLAVVLHRWRGDTLPHPAGGYAAAVVWLVLATAARGDTFVVPLAMAAICLAFAIGPERVAAWLGRQWLRAGREPDVTGAGTSSTAGWIEEDGRPAR
jgi:hypothetical protein